MKKFLFVFALLPLLVTAQDKEKSFELTGKIRHLPDTARVEWVFLRYRKNGETITDSSQPQHGKYSFKGKISEPTLASLRFRFAEMSSDKKPGGKYIGTTVFLEPGKQKAVSKDSVSNPKVSGSEAHAEYVKLNEQTKPYIQKIDQLDAKYTEYSKAKDKANQQKTEDEMDAIDNEMNDKVYGEYVKKNPSSPLAVYALKESAGWAIDPDKVEPLYNSLSDANKSYPSAVDFKENLEIAKKTGIGKLAMDFTQNDTAGSPVTLSSFKGHYVLVDFWASWCGPCRAENPNVVKVFDKYKDRNFHIIGVSLDRPGQRERWMKAIHDDGLAWTQVSDLKFWDNEVAKEYGIKAIPQNLLLDPDGKIIAKNLRGDELDQKLGEAIEGKKAF